MIEYRTQADDRPIESTRCKYNDDNLIIESRKASGETTFYANDEFDNAGKWMKLTESNENKKILYITQRRIAYRI